MSARQRADVAGDGPQLVEVAAIGSLSLLENATAYRLLDDCFQGL